MARKSGKGTTWFAKAVDLITTADILFAMRCDATPHHTAPRHATHPPKIELFSGIRFTATGQTVLVPDKFASESRTDPRDFVSSLLSCASTSVCGVATFAVEESGSLEHPW